MWVYLVHVDCSTGRTVTQLQASVSMHPSHFTIVQGSAVNGSIAYNSTTVEASGWTLLKGMYQGVAETV